MPVFNGAATIAGAIEALLAQTFGDFELIVSDNASTDGTRDVVEGLVVQDARIRYQRQATNIGANNNYSHLAVVARGEFLKWASASDWCAPTFLERCLELLMRNADAVLAAARGRWLPAGMALALSVGAPRGHLGAPRGDEKASSYVFGTAPVNAKGVKGMADLRGKPVLIDFWGTR